MPVVTIFWVVMIRFTRRALGTQCRELLWGTSLRALASVQPVARAGRDGQAQQREDPIKKRAKQDRVG